MGLIIWVLIFYVLFIVLFSIIFNFVENKLSDTHPFKIWWRKYIVDRDMED